MDVKYIEKARQEGWSVCTYGLGYLGKRLYKDIPSIFGLSADCYCDGNDSNVESIVLPGMKGIYKDDLIKTPNPTIVFILVDNPYDIEIKKILSVNKSLHTLTLRELTQMNSVIKEFYGEELFEKYMALPNNLTKK